MFLWTFIVFLMLGTILFIGLQKRDKVYLDLSSSLEQITKKYVYKNNSSIKINDKKIVFIEELIDNNYIDEDIKKNIDKYCIKSIVYTKGLLDDKYTINKECESKE